ncbi:Uncharacterised protein [Mycobacteroides abscessus subsp. abscessus]|nr:Uncharacterised protein [Mycobacteroides abscessus subsp. abscessus]
MKVVLLPRLVSAHCRDSRDEGRAVAQIGQRPLLGVDAPAIADV